MYIYIYNMFLRDIRTLCIDRIFRIFFSHLKTHRMTKFPRKAGMFYLPSASQPCRVYSLTKVVMILRAPTSKFALPTFNPLSPDRAKI